MRSPALSPAAWSAGCIVLMGLFILISGCSGSPGIPAGPLHEAVNSGELRVYFFDVSQGDSSLVLFRDKVVLIDAGDQDEGDRVAGHLRKLGVNHIDLLIATHPHSDHIGGMPELLSAFPVGKVLDSGIPHASPLYGQFLKTIDEKDIPYIIAEQGRTIDLDPSLRLLVLSPPKKPLDADLNANSIILKVSYGTTSFLFTGDAGTEAEDALLMTGYSPEAQVLKVAHHGSSDATSVSFLSRVRPEVAVISLSQDNPYGYPHHETLGALQAAVPAVYRTDNDGTILVRSNGTSYSVATENGQGGIWRSPSIPSPTKGREVPAPSGTHVSTPSAVVTLLTLPPVQIGNASSVRIDAVQFNAPGDDRENLNGEWVRIMNSGDGPVLIAGWTLSDMSGADPYIFPAFLLMSRASVTVYTGSGLMNDTALFMGRTEPVWGNSGDTTFLRDGRGEIIDWRSGRVFS